MLTYEHAYVEVWTLREEEREDLEGTAYTGLTAMKELLVVRKDTPRKVSYSLSNAPLATDKRTLAQWKANRYFVERTIQDTKTEAGWNDLSSAKYRVYMHTLAIDGLALWFVARIKLKMRPRQASSDAMKKLIERLHVKYITYWFTCPKSFYEEHLEIDRDAGHAGEVETSFARIVFPEYISERALHGDSAKLATKGKGQAIIHAIVEGICREVSAWLVAPL